MGDALADDSNFTISDFASQIKLDSESPIATGAFGKVHRCTINHDEGEKEVAVKVFIIDSKRPVTKLQRDIAKEAKVWFELSRSAHIVPLLGVANFSPESLPALVSEWMPSGTLDKYLNEHAETLALSARIKLTEGVAGGIHHLRSKNVIHGDLHPANVLIDCEGNPRLTDFGLATVVGDPNFRWGTTLAALELNARWRAPEVLGIGGDGILCDASPPTFMSDIYSLGSIIFFIISGDIPWKEKKNSGQISIELSHKATPTRPENILNVHWNSIQKCWSLEPQHRPDSKKVLEYIQLFGIDDPQASISNQPVDLTGQIVGEIKDMVAGSTFANVYRCQCKQASGHNMKVAVKVIGLSISEEELERFYHETKIWAVLEHDHIIRLLGTAREFGPSRIPVLIFPWVETTLPRVIQELGATLSIRSKLDLLIGTASALEHLHGLGIVHGDVTSPNVLVDTLNGKYRACLTDIGLATILGGRLGNRAIHESRVRLDAVRWTAPELLNGGSPTKENDMYSFGCVMFHLLTLHIPWYKITHDFTVVEHIRRGEQMLRPAPSDSPDLTDARWDMILGCWSAMTSASMAIAFLKSELEALSGDDETICGERGEHVVYPIRHEDTVDASASTVTDVSETPIDGRKTLFSEERDHRQAYSDIFDPEKKTASGDVTHPTHKEGLLPSSLASFDTTTSQPSSKVLTPPPLGPLNVLLFGETGIDKISIIKLIVGQNFANTAPGAPYSMLNRTAEATLKERGFQLWEVSFSKASMSFFKRFIAKWRLKASYKRLNRAGGTPLLLYCMNGTSAPTASREYKDFTDIVRSTSCASIAVVVDLEGSLTNTGDQWTRYKGDLEHLGMQFSHYVCITSLPNDSNTLQSPETICGLIEHYASCPPDAHHRRHPLVPL